MLKIIEKTKLWFAISLTVIIIGLIFMARYGLEVGIDFKGGTVVEINMAKDFNKEEADKIVKKYAPEAQTVKVNNTSLEIKSSSMSEENFASMFKDLKDQYKLNDSALVSRDEIGATIGKEIRNNAILALVLANLAMLVYIGIRFEFKFGAAAILSLIHDVLVTLGVYAIFRIPVDSGFIAAMLTVIGYSINDTIVVFDRIRENQKYMRGRDVAEIANASITQTMARSINTVLTVLITLVAVHLYVPSVRNFTEPLLVGIVSGMYSSIFIASPFWVMFKKMGHKNNKGKKAIA